MQDRRNIRRIVGEGKFRSRVEEIQLESYGWGDTDEKV